MKSQKKTGEIYSIEPTKYITEKFRKRKFILKETINNRHSGTMKDNYLEMEVINGLCDQLDDIKAGNKVNVNFQVGGRLWKNPRNGKMMAFLELKAIAVTRIG